MSNEKECYVKQYGCKSSNENLREITVDDFTFTVCPSCEQTIVWGVINGKV